MFICKKKHRLKFYNLIGFCGLFSMFIAFDWILLKNGSCFQMFYMHMNIFSVFKI